MEQLPGGSNGYHPQHNMDSYPGQHPIYVQQGASHLPGQQDFGSHYFAPQDFPASTSNSTHISNVNGYQIDNHNSGPNMENFAGGIPNRADFSRPDQHLDGSMQTSNMAWSANYQSSFSGNYNTSSVHSDQVLPNGGSSNFDHMEAMQLDSNGSECRVEELEFQPVQVMNVGNDARSSETYHYIIRLQNLLYSESSESQIPIRSSSKTLQLCTDVRAMLEDDSEWEKPVNFTKLLERPAHIVKDQCIKNLLREQLCVWLLQKIVERGRSANILDGEGQGVLHLVAALGYNWAIEAILAAKILSIDLEDVNKYTALDWASRMGRYHTVKLLKSRGATPRSGPEPNHPSPSDFSLIESMAKCNWLPHTDICQILRNHHKYPIKNVVPLKPPSGSIFLLNRKNQKEFRQDGYKWTKESHSVKEGFDLRTNYARGKENNCFVRRWYEMMKEKSDVILIHYLEVKDKASNSSRKDGSNLNGDHNSNDNPDSGEEHPHDYPHFGQLNGVNQRVWSNAGGHQNSYNNGSGRSHMQGSLTPEGSSESSCNENLHVEEKDNYSSSKQLLLDELMHDHEFEFEMIDSQDCGSSNEVEDVAEKTIQGTVGSEDKDDREHTEDMLSFPDANTRLVTDPSPARIPENFASSSQEVISFYLVESITLQDSSMNNNRNVVVATSVGYDDPEFGLSDDYTHSLSRPRTKKAGPDSKPIHMAAVKIQSKFRCWKGRHDFLLIRQQIIQIQAHFRGHLVRLKTAALKGTCRTTHVNEQMDVDSEVLGNKIRVVLNAVSGIVVGLVTSFAGGVRKIPVVLNTVGGILAGLVTSYADDVRKEFVIVYALLTTLLLVTARPFAYCLLISLNFIFLIYLTIMFQRIMRIHKPQREGIKIEPGSLKYQSYGEMRGISDMPKTRGKIKSRIFRELKNNIMNYSLLENYSRRSSVR